MFAAPSNDSTNAILRPSGEIAGMIRSFSPVATNRRPPLNGSVSKISRLPFTSLEYTTREPSGHHEGVSSINSFDSTSADNGVRSPVAMLIR